MFLGAAVMLALVRHSGDNRRLIVIPAGAGDAGLFADRGARAIGADQQTGGDGRAVGKMNINRVGCGLKTADRTGAQADAELFRLCHQRIDQMPVFDHVGERFTLFDLAAKC